MHDEVTVTIYDPETGRSIDESGFDAYWWAEGNGSCDCNREIFMGDADGNAETCLGCVRYRITRVEPMPAGYTLEDFNVGYPPEKGRAMNADEAALNAALDAEPGDVDTRRILADLYEEMGREEDAERERWLARIGKWPTFMAEGSWSSHPWDWFGSETENHRPAHAKLPHRVFIATAEYSRYTTRRAAEADLWRVREAFDAHPENTTHQSE